MLAKRFILLFLFGLSANFSQAAGAKSCSAIFRPPKITIQGRFSPWAMPSELIKQVQAVFENNLNEMLSKLTENQRQLAIQKINETQFLSEMNQMGNFDLKTNQLQLPLKLRHRILGLAVLLHEIRHSLDYNFRPKPQQNLVKELEVRAFSVEYRYVKDLLKNSNSAEILAWAIAEEASLNHTERFFIEYLFRNAYRVYDPIKNKFLLTDLAPLERETAVSVFKKFDQLTIQQMHMLFQAATLTEEAYVAKQLQRPSYYKQGLDQTVSTWGYVDSP